MKNKFILDACCGSRMFWFNKKHPNTIFQDIRTYDKGFIDNRPNRELHPDKLGDFRQMDFPDKSFKLVVFDPPHLIGKPDGCRMTKTYGSLNAETWQSDIKKGFDECWRVLDDYGILIFKWNDASKKRAELLKIIGKEPLFGHPNGSKIPTHWFCFMKIPELMRPQTKPVSGKQLQLKKPTTKVVPLNDGDGQQGGLGKTAGDNSPKTKEEWLREEIRKGKVGR